MNDREWKFRVEGIFVKDGAPISSCEAIIESGERSEASPFRFRGVGPIAKADGSGMFRSWYITDGSNDSIAIPDTVSIFVRVAKGAWEPIVVNIDPEKITVLSDTEMHLDLGAIDLPLDMRPYARDAHHAGRRGIADDYFASK